MGIEFSKRKFWSYRFERKKKKFITTSVAKKKSADEINCSLKDRSFS